MPDIKIRVTPDIKIRVTPLTSRLQSRTTAQVFGIIAFRLNVADADAALRREWNASHPSNPNYCEPDN